MTARELLQQAISLLEKAACDSPRLDAELLLMFVLGINQTALIIRMQEGVAQDAEQHFKQLLSRRQQREPIAYILGEKEFWSRSFHVSSDVLIPRPETEHLIEQLLQQFPDTSKPYQFCDIGTGSGCIAITLACEYPQSHVIATDISTKALVIAKDNALRHGVSDRMSFQQGDMYAALNAQSTQLDAIVSNPPYVTQTEMSSLETELNFEPRHALTDEKNGLYYLDILLQQGSIYLKNHGIMIVETGCCGLPKTPDSLTLIHHYHDLAGLLRGGVYQN
ncbi:MAG: peptide chain release factor N(5)-glutamine methyltransferase [Mariprofundaceae bacterium]